MIRSLWSIEFRGPKWLVKHLVAIYLLAVGVAYCALYCLNSARPRAGARYPLGWYGWADQGEYLKSTLAFASGNLSPAAHLYPPLYNLIAAPFSYILPTQPHFLPDLVFLLFYVYVLMSISRRLYTTFLVPAVFTTLMIAAPLLSIVQWVIPWTTSLQAALISALFLCFIAFERRDRPFVLAGTRDYAVFGAFFVAYGALLPTRPLDLIAIFPFALYFFARVTITTAFAEPRAQRLKVIRNCVLAAGLSGSVFVAFYFIFNILVFKSPFGSYLNSISAFRYDITVIPEKAYSIFLDSAALYGESHQAFFERVPLLAPALALCIVAAFVYNDIRRWIIVCALLQITLYLPYGDFLPTGVFRFYNLHYFKWTYPWIFVIAAGQAIVWCRGPRSRAKWRPIAIAAGIVLVVANVSIVPTNIEPVNEGRSLTEHTISISLSRTRNVSFIDIHGLHGGFTDFYFGNHAAVLNGTLTINRREFRLLPIPNGARLLFSRPTELSTLLLKPDASVKLEPDGPVSVESFHFGFACWLHSCRDGSKSL